MRSSNVRALAEALPPQTVGAQAGPEVWFHSSCLTEPSVSEVVDREELSRIGEAIDAVMHG